MTTLEPILHILTGRDLPPRLPLASLSGLAGFTLFGLRRTGEFRYRLRLLDADRWNGKADKHSLRHIPQVSQQVPAVRHLHGLGRPKRRRVGNTPARSRLTTSMCRDVRLAIVRHFRPVLPAAAPQDDLPPSRTQSMVPYLRPLRQAHSSMPTTRRPAAGVSSVR